MSKAPSDEGLELIGAALDTVIGQVIRQPYAAFLILVTDDDDGRPEVHSLGRGGSARTWCEVLQVELELMRKHAAASEEMFKAAMVAAGAAPDKVG